jgi:threonine aldolase
MTTTSDTSDTKSLVENLRRNPEAIVFAGDGEPQTPESTIELLSDLLAQDKLRADSYLQGGTVQEFEERMADELGKESAIWMPTGTMANVIALRKHCGTNARVALQEQSHIYHDEGDALSSLCGINGVPLAPGRSYFTIEELESFLDQSLNGRVKNKVGAVSIESPVRRQAGQIVPWDDMKSITDLCREKTVPGST